jgi:SsrA-binding protein
MDNKKTKEFINKKGRFDYKIEDTLETGIVLVGTEIKAIRNGRVNINSSYAKIFNGEVVWLGSNFDIQGDNQRTKKLLLHQKEIAKLIGKTAQDGYSLIPLKLYLKRGKAKLLLGIGKGMKKYEKRDKIKDREQEREIASGFKGRCN